jgi:6-pyruvoyl-tetrahydropterin synthase
MEGRMQIELVVILSLTASHALHEREEPHSHRWEIQVGLKGDLKQGRIVSLTAAQSRFQQSLVPLDGTFLNNNKFLDSSSRAEPTCENLAVFLKGLFEKDLKSLEPSGNVQLSFIQVGILEDSNPLGFAKLSV